MKTKIIEIFGWYGVFVILGAYSLANFNILASTSLMYQLLNATGALGIMIISLHKRAYQPAFLNIAWAIVAIVAILSLLF